MRAPADGYTLLGASVSMMSINPHTFPKLPYDPEKDFAPITNVYRTNYFWVASTAAPAATLQDYVAWAKANPRKASFGSAGIGSISHLASAMLSQAAGDIDSSHIGSLHGMHTMAKATEYDMGTQARFVAGDIHPKFEIVHRPNGLLQGARRQADGNQDYWRIGGWFLPCFTMLPGFPGDSPLGGHAWVPVDDHKVWVFGVNWHPTRALTNEELGFYREGTPTGLHSTLIPGTFIAKRNKSNGYADPDAPPAKQPWQRITIFQDQDTAVTESIGAQFDRTQELLCGSDIVIVNMRRRLIAAARELMEGREPPTDPEGFRVCGFSCVLPRDTASWADAVAEALDARPETFTFSV